MNRVWGYLGIAAVVLAAFGGGYVLAPKEQLDREVRQSGVFTVDTTEVLSATVQSLKKENKLQVYQFKGEVSVEVTRSKLWGLLEGRQQMMVPAAISYYVDLSQLGMNDVTYDAQAKQVNVALPPLVLGDIAFQPERARTVNGGLLTFSQEQVDELAKLNYATARRAFTAQAQDSAMIEQARQNALQAIKAQFEIPLRVVGKPDVKVVAAFRI